MQGLGFRTLVYGLGLGGSHIWHTRGTLCWELPTWPRTFLQSVLNSRGPQGLYAAYL